MSKLIDNPPGPRSTAGLADRSDGSSGGPVGKVFAKPFYLVFKKVATQEVTWIKVESLRGLKNVIEQVAGGKLSPVNAAATLDRQLWGLLAEYTGFLRTKNTGGHFSAGIQPLGSEFASLGDDMTELFGGFDTALTGLNEIRQNVVGKMEGTEPTTLGESRNLVDGDFPTPEGEEVLKELFATTEAEDVEEEAPRQDADATSQSEQEPPEDSD